MPLDPTQTVISSLYIYKKRLYVGLADYRVVVVDLSSFTKITEIIEELWEVKSIYSDDTGIYIASLNEKVNFYDVDDDQLKNTISHELVSFVLQEMMNIFTQGHLMEMLTFGVNLNSI